MTRSLSVVIPAYNEQDGIGGVIAEVRNLLERHGIETEILVVDDGSADRTAQAAAAAGARVVRHRSNRGYGAGLKTGIIAARFDNVAIIDADGTYPASYLPAMLEMLDRADMVVGARTGNNVRIPLVRRPAKWVLTRLANYLTGSRIPDLNSGLRVFRRNIARQYFPILPDQFSWTTTITLALHCDKYAVAYLPIDYRERKGKSKIVPWDAGTFFMLMLRTIMLFRPLRVFLPIVFACLVYGAVKTSIDLTHQPNISASALLAFLSALLVLLIGMVSDAIAMRLGRIGMEATASVRAEEYSDEENAAAGESHR